VPPLKLFKNKIVLLFLSNIISLFPTHSYKYLSLT
jgi:hypothetical protein